MVRCSECGLAFSVPGLTPEELKRIYDKPYFTGGYDTRQNYVEGGDPQLLWSALLRRIERETEGRSLLDVGSGLGFFPRAARARGWRAQGVELSEWAATYARQQLGVDVVCGELHEINDTYDVVTMWSFLEHTSDPLGVLRMARNRIRHGGILCIGVPNLGSVDVLLRGERALCFKREHLFYFTRRTLTRMLFVADYVDVKPLVFWGGFDRSLTYLLGQYVSRALGISTQITLVARPDRSGAV